MTVSDNITKLPILPVITIAKTGGGVYTYNPFVPTFDFRLTGTAVFEPPFDAVGGKMSFSITSADGGNSGANTILSNIEEGNEVTVWIGKDNSSKSKLLLGIIESIDIDEQNKNFMLITISGPDWGSDIMKNRIVNGQWVQRRDASGNPDNTDSSTTITNIVLDLLQKDQSYPSVDFTVEDQGIVVDSGNIVPIDYKLSTFNANMEFLDDKFQELDDLSGSIHYVDPDKNFIMKQTFPSTSILTTDTLLTDDNTDSVAVAWDSTKVGLIDPDSTIKRTLEHHKRRIFGVGGLDEQIDQQSTTTTAYTDLDSAHLAQKFTPKYRSLTKIHLYLAKVGTPPNDFVMELREDNNNTPTGEVLRTILKNKNFLDVVSATPDIRVFDIDEELNTSKDYWIVIRKTGTASNTFRWYHDNTDNNPSTSATSSDDVTWNITTTPNRFKYAFQTYRGLDLLAVHRDGSSSATSKHFHEDVIRKADITDPNVMRFMLRQAGNTMFKRKEIFKGSVYAPDTLLTTGQPVRIRKQASGYVVDAVYIIGKIEYIFEASDDGCRGSFHYKVEATRYVAY